MASRSEPAGLAGRAHPPGRSVAIGMHLDVSDGVARLTDGAGALWVEAAASDVRRDMPLGRLARKATFPDGTTFETPDADGFDAAFGQTDAHRLHAMERFGPWLIAVGIACLLGVFMIWRYALPAMVAAAVWGTPDVMLRQMDAGTITTLDRILLDDSALSRPEQADVAALHAAILERVDPGDLPATTLLFRSSGLGPNAFALPGGTVVVTDDLARMLADDPDAMAGVLAHELTHVTERHGLTALYRSLSLYIVIGLLAGDTGAVLDEVLLEGNVLLSLAGSRAAEREADDGAVRLMQDAGFDPEGLARFFDRIGEIAGDGNSWASTHPGSAERAETIRSQARGAEDGG